MKKGFRSDTDSVFIITCDNLREYFAEFAKYRNSISENKWAEGLNKFYGEGTVAFKEDDGNNRIVEFLLEDYDNVFGGANGRIELEIPVNLKENEYLSQKEKINQTLKDIWASREMKNNYGLDLDWPVASQPDQNRLPNNTDKNRIKDQKRENSWLKEQLKKETNNKNIWMVISISMVVIFSFTLLFCWLKIKKLKKR